MARPKNIFDFASKELSGTAFWAWVLDADGSGDTGLGKVSAGLRRKLGVPADAFLESIELEKNPDDPGLAVQEPLAVEERVDRRRIDILATYRMADGGFLRLVIENKVRRDRRAIEQVLDYRDRLQRRVTGPVRAAVFTFDNSLTSSSATTDRAITVFALAEMVELLEEAAAANAIVDAYLDFLRDRVTIANASPVGAAGEVHPENLARWSIVADQRGIGSLLDAYVACAEELGFSVTRSKGRSVFLTIKSRSPVISVHPSKSTAVNGLWLGVSVTNLARTHGAAFGRSDMPADFAWQVEMQSGNEWRFGYVDADRIMTTLRSVASRVMR